MKHTLKKTLAVLLALLLTFSAFGALAFQAAAAEPGHKIIMHYENDKTHDALYAECDSGGWCEVLEGLGLENHVTLTLLPPEKTVYGDDKSPNATLDNADNFNKFTGANAQATDIVYYQKFETAVDESGAEFKELDYTPTEAGNYWAELVVFLPQEWVGLLLTSNYTIAKAAFPADATVVAPTAKEGLVYNGKLQDLIDEGSTTFGSMLYKVGDGEFGTAVPQAMDVGSYTVSYYADGGRNYESTAVQTLTVTITADKTELQTAVFDAQSYYNTIKDDYPDAAAALKTAIENASGINGAELAPQADVDAAKAALDSAVTTAQTAVAAAQAADQAAADAVEAKIAAIGDVTYTDESKAKIDDAQKAFDALTDAQKALVENKGTLDAAAKKYAELKAEAEKPTEPDKPTDPTEPEIEPSDDKLLVLIRFVVEMVKFLLLQVIPFIISVTK